MNLNKLSINLTQIGLYVNILGRKFRNKKRFFRELLADYETYGTQNITI